MPKRIFETLENGNISVTIPLVFRSVANRRKIITPDSAQPGSEPMILAIARGRRWQALIDEGRFANATELARSLGRDPGNIACTLRLGMLAPEVVKRIIAGKYPVHLTLEKLRGPLPEIWDDQIKFLFGE